MILQSLAGAAEASPSGGWLTLLPPLIAIGCALAFRQVVPALLAGIWVGGWIAYGGPFVGILRALDHYLVGALADRDHMFIVLFTLLLGGMIGIVARTGGTTGLVERLRPYATDDRRGQAITWLLGVLVFFDDYANTLLVGNFDAPRHRPAADLAGEAGLHRRLDRGAGRDDRGDLDLDRLRGLADRRRAGRLGGRRER